MSSPGCLRRPGAGFLPRPGGRRAVPARDGLPQAGRLFREAADAGGFSMSTPAGFVGRRSELRILGERLAAAEMGQPQVVYVEGEAGGGKSTLLSRFLGSLPARTLSCSRLAATRQRHCSPTGSSISCSLGSRRSPGPTRWRLELGCWTCSTGCNPAVRSSCSPLTICNGRTGRRRVRCCLPCAGCVRTRCWRWCRPGSAGWPIPAGRGSWAVIRGSLVSVWAG